MPDNPIRSGKTSAIDEALLRAARDHPEALLEALGLIRWLAADQDGSNDTAQQSLNDIEDLATAAINRR